jgi:hypothetical protein
MIKEILRIALEEKILLAMVTDEKYEFKSERRNISKH